MDLGSLLGALDADEIRDVGRALTKLGDGLADSGGRARGFLSS